MPFQANVIWFLKLAWDTSTWKKLIVILLVLQVNELSAASLFWSTKPAHFSDYVSRRSLTRIQFWISKNGDLYDRLRKKFCWVSQKWTEDISNIMFLHSRKGGLRWHLQRYGWIFWEINILPVVDNLPICGGSTSAFFCKWNWVIVF